MKKPTEKLLSKVIGFSLLKPSKPGGGSLDRRVSPDVLRILKVVWHR